MLQVVVPGGLLALGVAIAVVGLPSRAQLARGIHRYRSSDLAVATVIGGAGLLLTQWWAGAVLAFVGGLFIPYILRRRREVEKAIRKTEAVAGWIENVRDTLVTGDMKDAIIASSSVAPEAIRGELQLLQARLLRKEPLGDALRQFARDLDDATGDLAVAALALAYERQGQNLRAVLALMAQSAREEAQMQRRVQAGRARLQTVATIVTVFSLVVLVLLVQLNPQAVAEYNKASGQIALLVIGMVFAGGLLLLVRMGEVRKIPRFLSRR
jgi:tight adherence protein B